MKHPKFARGIQDLLVDVFDRGFSGGGDSEAFLAAQWPRDYRKSVWHEAEVLSSRANRAGSREPAGLSAPHAWQRLQNCIHRPSPWAWPLGALRWCLCGAVKL